jgi:UrcA family protein
MLQVARRRPVFFVEFSTPAVERHVRQGRCPATTRSSSRTPSSPGFATGDFIMIKTVLFAAAAAAATLATASPVLADQVSVSYKDLDLSTPQGQSTLSRRLDVAARNACGYSVGRTGTRMPSRSAVECYRQAQAQSHDTMAEIMDQTRKGG